MMITQGEKLISGYNYIRFKRKIKYFEGVAVGGSYIKNTVFSLLYFKILGSSLCFY